MEVDVEDDRTVGFDRHVRESDQNLLEPKDGWKTLKRVYCISFGQRDTPVAAKEQVDLQDMEGLVKVNVHLTLQIGPLSGAARRLVLDHPLIEKDETLRASLSTNLTLGKVGKSISIELVPHIHLSPPF